MICWLPELPGFHERKAHRRAYFERFVYGLVLQPCGACAGSGRYDHHGSPPCSACEGTGKERVPGPKAYKGIRVVLGQP